MNYLLLVLFLVVVCAPGWVIVFLLLRFWGSFNVVFKVKEKRVEQEKKAVAPDIIPDVDMNQINERLDKALALSRESEAVESHVSGLGKEVAVESEDHSSAVSKLRNIGK